jgi:hypothetical protein
MWCAQTVPLAPLLSVCVDASLLLPDVSLRKEKMAGRGSRVCGPMQERLIPEVNGQVIVLMGKFMGQAGMLYGIDGPWILMRPSCFSCLSSHDPHVWGGGGCCGKTFPTQRLFVVVVV